jgi:hypothetical protein
MAWCSVKKAQGRIYFYLTEIGWGVVDWIYLFQDRDKRRALLNTVMNISV